MVLHLDWVADPAESEAGELPENFILEDLARTLLCHMVVWVRKRRSPLLSACGGWESCDPPPPPPPGQENGKALPDLHQLQRSGEWPFYLTW